MVFGDILGQGPGLGAGPGGLLPGSGPGPGHAPGSGPVPGVPSDVIPELGPAFPVVIPIGSPGKQAGEAAASTGQAPTSVPAGVESSNESAEAAMWHALADVIRARLLQVRPGAAAKVSITPPDVNQTMLPPVGEGLGMGALPPLMGALHSAGDTLPVTTSGYVTATLGGDSGLPISTMHPTGGSKLGGLQMGIVPLGLLLVPGAPTAAPIGLTAIEPHLGWLPVRSSGRPRCPMLAHTFL